MDYQTHLIELLGKEVNVYIDRPLGSRHPDYNDLIYPLNYGYIKEIIAPDNEYQDAYVLDVNEPIESCKGIVIAIIERLDDNENKLIVSVNIRKYSDSEIEELISFQEKYFKHKIIRK